MHTALIPFTNPSPTNQTHTHTAPIIKRAHRNRAKDDVKVTLGDDGVLEIRAEHSAEKEDKDAATGQVRWRERSHGAFYRAFALPEGVDAGGVAAAVKDGVLTVTVPKAPEKPKAAPREIPVAGGGEA